MGRVDTNPEHRQGQGQRKRKSKGRMSYLKRRKEGGDGKPATVESKKTDEHGQIYGDYVPAYHGRGGYGPGKYHPRRWQGNGHGHGNYYQNGGGNRPKEHLKPGMKGFLCTTNFKEWECVRDTYNILNEYSENDGVPVSSEGLPKGDQKDVQQDKAKAENTDKTEFGKGTKNPDLKVESTATVEESVESTKTQIKTVEIVVTGETDSTPENCQSKVEEPTAAKSDEVGLKNESPEESTTTPKNEADKEGRQVDDDDIDAALSNELKELKEEKTAWKFKSVNTGITNVIFIKTTIDDPTELAHKIFEDVFSKKEPKSRHLLRMVPVDYTCQFPNNLDELKAKVTEYIEKYLKTGYVSYKIEVNVRYTAWYGKGDLIQTLAEMVFKANPLSFVDLNNPQYTIMIEVIKNVACIGVLKDFAKFKRYNLFETGLPDSLKQQKGGKNGRNQKDNGKKTQAGKVDDVGSGDKAKEDSVKKENEGENVLIKKEEVQGDASKQVASPVDSDIAKKDSVQTDVSNKQEGSKAGKEVPAKTEAQPEIIKEGIQIQIESAKDAAAVPIVDPAGQVKVKQETSKEEVQQPEQKV